MEHQGQGQDSAPIVRSRQDVLSKEFSPDYSRARTTRTVKMLNLSLKIEISDFHVFQHYVSLKILLSAKSSAS
jgi:hypothetical protein